MSEVTVHNIYIIKQTCLMMTLSAIVWASTMVLAGGGAAASLHGLSPIEKYRALQHISPLCAVANDQPSDASAILNSEVAPRSDPPAGFKRAAMIDPVTPQSYSLSFAEKVLPIDGKVVSVDLHVEQAEAIRVRSLPRGWISSTLCPRRAKFNVSIELFSWGKDKGFPLSLEELDDRIWIVASPGENDKPLLPIIQVRVSYVLPGKNMEKTVRVETMWVESSFLRLTYIP